jgi:hypothetical protein
MIAITGILARVDERRTMFFCKLMIAGLILMPGDAFAESLRQFSGVAAYYSTNYSGRTARGDRYDPTKLTAAHRSLPFGIRLRVTDPGSPAWLSWSMTAAPSPKAACLISRWRQQRPCA